MFKEKMYPLPMSRAAWTSLSAFISIISTLLLFLLVYLNLDRGFNFSDEGMYLYSIAHPQWPWSLLSDFGAFLHPIYMALGKDLYSFRVWTFLVLIISAKLLIISFLLLCKRHMHLPFKLWCAISFALWSCTLGYYTYWLPTASYNTLAIVGIFGILTMLNFYTLLCRPYAKGHALHQGKLRNYLIITVLFFLSLFGVLAFIGKTTTGAGMGILAAIWILLDNGTYQRAQRMRHIGLAAIMSLVILFIYLFAMSDGIETIKKIILCAELLDNSYGFDKTLAFYAQYLFPTSYVLVLLTWPIWAAALWTTHTEKYRLALGLSGLAVLVGLVTAYIWIGSYITALMLVPLTIILLVGAYLWKASFKHLYLSVRLSVVFLFSGLIYHAGTNTPLEYKMSEALILPALGIISLCVGMVAKKRLTILPTLAVILCCASLGSLLYSIFEPTRHNGKALWELNEPVVLQENTRPILVHPERKLFMEWLSKTAYDNGWQAGTPVINTSYYSSGSLFLLDGYKMEGAWQIQERYTPKENYPIIFSLAPKESLHKAWIIKPHKHKPRYMATSVLQELGLPFPEGYEMLGISPPESLEGVWPAEQYEIWKPKQ